MERKNVHDRRQVKLENMLKSDYIPYLSGRPERETIINEDDRRNLMIALNTATSLDEFITMI